MYTIKSAETLETVLPPKKLLFLCDAALDERAGEISESIGEILASYPFTSPRYASEVAQVWRRYAQHAHPDEDVDAALGLVRTKYSERIVAAMPFITAPPVQLQHCKALVSLLKKVSATTAFNRTGDQLVYKVILSEIPRKNAAELSLYEVPYKMAGQFYGDAANRRVRSLFERNIENEFATTTWETETSIERFILFFVLLFETGTDLNTSICCNHELALYNNRTRVAPFCWGPDAGVVCANRIVYQNKDIIFPIPTLALHFLELAVLLGLEGSDAAASILCAVKTPEKARAKPILLVPPPPRQLTRAPSPTGDRPGQPVPPCAP